MTCEDCIHYEAHRHFDNFFGFNDENVERLCPVFKDKSKYTEQPCKVGDMVYEVSTDLQIHQSKIKSIIYNTNGIAFDERAINETIFLTKDEAEQKLKKLKENA